MDASDILQVDDAVLRRIAADHDIAELLLCRQAAIRQNGKFKGLGRGLRRRAHRSGRDLKVLLVDSTLDVVDGQPQLRHLICFQPYAHTEIIGPAKNVAHSGRTQQDIPQVDIGIVVHERNAMRMLRRIDGHQHQDGRITLQRGKTQLLHLRGQGRRRNTDTVLNIQRHDIGIGSYIKSSCDLGGAIVTAVTLHIRDTRHPVDLGLDSGGCGLFDRLRIRANKITGDLYRRWGDVRVLADRHVQDRQCSHQQNDQ